MGEVRPRLLVYAAKFLCGRFDTERAGDQEGVEGPVRPGIYTTAINVHNPNPRRPVTFRKKAVLLFEGPKPILAEEMERPMPPGPMLAAELGPDWALEIDCIDIRKRLLPNVDARAFIKGMVVIETMSDTPLDVVAVYTAEAIDAQRSHGLSIEIERVTPTLITL